MTNKSPNGKFENRKKMRKKLAGQNGADISTGTGTKARQSRAEQEKKDNQTPRFVLSRIKKEVVREAQQAFENHMRSFRFGSSIQSGEMACVSLCAFFLGVRRRGHASPRKRLSRRGRWGKLAPV